MMKNSIKEGQVPCSPEITDSVMRKESRFRRTAYVLLSFLVLFVFIIAILTGRYNCSKLDLFYSFWHRFLDYLIAFLNYPAKLFHLDYSVKNPIPVTWGKNVDTVMWNVRIPRIIAVCFVGGGLSIAGASYQCVFRNPLVSEGILGVSNGASFGAVLAIFLGLSTGMVSTFAFCGGLLAVFLTYSCSKVFRGNATLLLVLSGTVVGSLLSAGNSIIKYLAPTDTKLPEIVFWLMGSFASVTTSKLTIPIPLIIVCTLGILCMRWQLNLMALGEDEAKALGVNVSRNRSLIIIFATIITSASVCICGIIGWVGMIVPQVTRMIVGPDARRLIPCTFASGAIFMMLVDIICRTLIATEIPVGIVTSIIGAPIFLIFLTRVKEGWA